MSARGSRPGQAHGLQWHTTEQCPAKCHRQVGPPATAAVLVVGTAGHCSVVYHLSSVSLVSLAWPWMPLRSCQSVQLLHLPWRAFGSQANHRRGPTAHPKTRGSSVDTVLRDYARSTQYLSGKVPETCCCRSNPSVPYSRGPGARSAYLGRSDAQPCIDVSLLQSAAQRCIFGILPLCSCAWQTITSFQPGGVPKDEVQPVVQVSRHAGAFQGSPRVLQQELAGRGSPGRHLHVAYHPPALALPQGQPLVVQEEAAQGGSRSSGSCTRGLVFLGSEGRCCGLAQAS